MNIHFEFAHFNLIKMHYANHIDFERIPLLPFSVGKDRVTTYTKGLLNDDSFVILSNRVLKPS